ncbi:uncharacterized protein LOC135226502 [Macrobrachium nipponense]|uniref:uncharacterized protein LOC135226502 n=1 Tax=Macrobrachium nipponense TaxID=159736 RepID=UPI0030C7E26E
MLWAVSVFLILLLLPLKECTGASFRGLLSSLAETMEQSRESAQHASALKNFRSFSCTQRKDGLYPDLSSECSSYYRCLDGAVYSYLCPSGQILTYGSDECRPKTEASCPEVPPATGPCVNQPDGFYPNYSEKCRSYYGCQNKSVVGGWWCERGAVWDLSTGSCKSGGDLVCSPPSCWGLPDGPHPSPASSCNAIFRLQEWRPHRPHLSLPDHLRLLSQAMHAHPISSLL